jgi:hypothetical protein
MASLEAVSSPEPAEKARHSVSTAKAGQKRALVTEPKIRIAAAAARRPPRSLTNAWGFREWTMNVWIQPLYICSQQFVGVRLCAFCVCRTMGYYSTVFGLVR